MKIKRFIFYTSLILIALIIFGIFLAYYLFFEKERSNKFVCRYPEIKFPSTHVKMVDVPRTHLPLYKQKIPFSIVQTNFRNTVPPRVKYTSDHMIEQNPEYDYVYFDDERCRKFLIDNYDPIVIECYDLIVPGAYKADIFRAFYLQKKGGIYLDCGQRVIIPFRDIIREDDEFVSCKDFKPIIFEKYKEECIYNAFMACVPGNPIVKKYCDIIIQNITNRYYGSNTLAITGPHALGKAFFSVTGKKPAMGDFGNGIRLYKLSLSGNILDDGKLFITDGNIDLITTKYEGYYEDRSKSNKPHYGLYFFSGQVYGEKGVLPTKFEKNYKKPIEKDEDKFLRKKKVFNTIKVYNIPINPKKKVTLIDGDEDLKINLPIPKNKIEEKVAKFLIINNPDYDFEFSEDGDVDLTQCIITPLRKLKGNIVVDGKIIFRKKCGENIIEKDYLIAKAVL